MRMRIHWIGRWLFSFSEYIFVNFTLILFKMHVSFSTKFVAPPNVSDMKQQIPKLQSFNDYFFSLAIQRLVDLYGPFHWQRRNSIRDDFSIFIKMGVRTQHLLLCNAHLFNYWAACKRTRTNWNVIKKYLLGWFNAFFVHCCWASDINEQWNYLGNSLKRQKIAVYWWINISNLSSRCSMLIRYHSRAWFIFWECHMENVTNCRDN